MTLRSMHAAPGDDSPLAPYTGNVSHCWRCSHCKWVPSPKSHEFAHACPSVQWGKFHAYSAGGKINTAYALKEGVAGYSSAAMESIFACTMCGACDTSCKNNNGEIVEPLPVLHALRSHVAAEGESLPVHLAMIESLRLHGNPAGQLPETRSDWCAGLNIANALSQPVDVLLHIGCDNAFDERAWPELRAIVDLLNRAGVRFGIAHDREISTGEIAYDLGFQDDARALATKMAGVIADCGAGMVVTCSAGSYAAFRNVWPRLGVTPMDCGVVHITDFIDRLIEGGQLQLGGAFAGRVTYHDPCKLGRLSEAFEPSDAKWTKVLNTVSVRERPTQVLFGNNGLYDAPRRLLERLEGLELVEMERNRVASYCCGGGGGAKEAFPEFAQFAARNRLSEAAATGASVVVTACEGCRCHIDETAKGDEAKVEVFGIFAFLASCARTSDSGGGA
jgi:Fe-S oxidoreductase